MGFSKNPIFVACLSNSQKNCFPHINLNVAALFARPYLASKLNF
jgi:hypothetical protein